MPVLLQGKSHGQRSLEGYIQSIGPQRIGRGRSDLACTYVQRSKAPGPTPRRAKLALNAPKLQASVLCHTTARKRLGFHIGFEDLHPSTASASPWFTDLEMSLETVASLSSYPMPWFIRLRGVPRGQFIASLLLGHWFCLADWLLKEIQQNQQQLWSSAVREPAGPLHTPARLNLPELPKGGEPAPGSRWQSCAPGSV